MIHSRAGQGGAVATRSRELPHAARSQQATAPARLRPVLALNTLRGPVVRPLPLLVAAVADRLTGYHPDTPEPPERGSWPRTLVATAR
ncbi:hypothetical protein [Streptomyces sp. SM11]|uniref:hypothetical protein n=1 Tax=Streptomyces sp. SM11 TaxID=565557 RepID=UPI000CD52234|nr:hypothetical protein [Streptomyces sp. SM11]